MNKCCVNRISGEIRHYWRVFSERFGRPPAPEGPNVSRHVDLQRAGNLVCGVDALISEEAVSDVCVSASPAGWRLLLFPSEYAARPQHGEIQSRLIPNAASHQNIFTETDEQPLIRRSFLFFIDLNPFQLLPVNNFCFLPFRMSVLGLGEHFSPFSKTNKQLINQENVRNKDTNKTKA